MTFETPSKLCGGPSLVFAHSLGNNVFRYFLEWLRLEIAQRHYFHWLDEHIHAYFAVGMLTELFHICGSQVMIHKCNNWFCFRSPSTGSGDALKGSLSGCTFGLPVSEEEMMPFLKYSRGDSKYWNIDEKHKDVHRWCDEKEFKSNYSGWPTNIIHIDIPSVTLENMDVNSLFPFSFLYFY
ncbi:Phospholipid--sterol O-acyltransferase-like protein [Drosera capensis]